MNMSALEARLQALESQVADLKKAAAEKDASTVSPSWKGQYPINPDP